MAKKSVLAVNGNSQVHSTSQTVSSRKLMVEKVKCSLVLDHITCPENVPWSQCCNSVCNNHLRNAKRVFATYRSGKNQCACLGIYAGGASCPWPSQQVP
ncbi:hypothetical protein SLEP1_g49772 [Rubroshorea leprosula]|nr:hypothetical protein SLEP1_g49772 [Rubroshorea leprosula]